MSAPTVCLTPDVRGVGGMVSFRRKLTAGLTSRGLRVTTDLKDPEVEAVLVIGGTRDLPGLRRIKQRRIPIIQRLDGMNWLHRRLNTGLRHFLRAEAGNWLLRLIRSGFSDRIVYQSRFSKQWWERVHGPAAAPDKVIYNAVDLNAYSPDGPAARPHDHYRVLLVEGSLQGGYETGLETAVQLVHTLRDRHRLPARLAVAGKVSAQIRSRYAHLEPTIDWLGLVAPERIPFTDRSAHLLFSGDLNAACPNAVIEALACGLPAAAFDTGALAELVPPSAGRIVPYNGDPWMLEPPDLPALAAACVEVLENGPVYREGARAWAEAAFNLDTMVDGYEAVLLHTEFTAG